MDTAAPRPPQCSVYRGGRGGVRLFRGNKTESLTVSATCGIGMASPAFSGTTQDVETQSRFDSGFSLSHYSAKVSVRIARHIAGISESLARYDQVKKALQIIVDAE